MNGQLSEHPLGELIREFREKGLSGKLRLEHQRRKVVIYLENGQIIYATSNVRSLRLAEHLKSHQLVDEAQLEAFSEKQSDLSLATALSDNGIANFNDLEPLISELVSKVLHAALVWTNGTWHFETTVRLDEPIRFEVDTARLLLETARKSRLTSITERFSNPDEIISRVDGHRNGDGLTPAEGFLLSRVEGQMKVGELVAISGLRELDAVRSIYALSLAGYLRRENWKSALVEQAPAFSRRRPQDVTPPPVEPKRSEEDELKDFLTRMDAAVSFYDVLGIGPDAPGPQVKQAYYGLARKYHPDRFRGAVETPLHTRLESTFARVTQAYETLMDRHLRTAYDAKLAAAENKDRFVPTSPKPVPVVPRDGDKAAGSDKPQAEDSFTEGLSALKQGQVNVAVGLLAASARAVPDEPRYRAYYGRALAANPKTRHSAEAEMQAAIRLAPEDASYRVMLAELYRDLGFSRRAYNEVNRALTIEPGNVQARELLKQLK